MTSHGSFMALLRLIITVSNRGGFKAVSENASWDKVGQESGLGLGAKLIYVKYLAALARWLNSDSSPGLPGTSKDLIARLRDFVSQAKSKYELRKVGGEFKWLLVKVDKDRSSPGKTKRECSVETLKWLSEAAKDPCDTSNGSLPDRSKWDSYGSEEPWKQLLLFRASRTNTTDSACEKTWQKIQKIHPSLYRDSAGPSYNLRERLSSQFNERKAGKDESCGLLCSEFQAQVPDWSLIASESDSKWFDTLMPPLNKEQNNNNRLSERDPIGNADSNKMLTMLVSAMGECAFSILREPAEPQRFLDEDSLHDFCISTLKITSCLVEDVIASLWISPPELIHLCASFPETGDNIKHSKKVSMAFKLCIRTVWNCVRLLCLKFVNVESNSSEDFASEKAVADFMSEACCKSAYYLDVLEQHGELEIEELQIFEDINKSLNLWVWIQSSETIPLENVIPLLFNVIDLVSIKGWLELHQRIYDLMFRVFKGRNVRLKDALAMLWDCRRLSHALCPSPVDDAVITGLSCYFDEISESTDFWKSCLQFSKAKSIGFELSIHESDITIDEIKCTASKLDTTSKPVSSDPFTCFSSFVAACLYYDLCERELSCGNLYEALSCAKEAHRIRNFLLQKWFRYGGESTKTVEIMTFVFKKFQVSSLRDTDSWPCGTFLWDISRCYLSPWILLQCCLESVLQLGGIYELMGERDRAGTLLSWGKTVSSIQSLQPFVLAFSLALGNLYNKMQCWDLAEKELQNAKKLLTDSQRDFPCRNCKLMLEVTLDKQFGDLSQRQSESLYSAALQKICCPAWKGCINQTAEVEKPRDSKRRRGGGAIIVHACEMKEQPILRLTRSMSRSLEERPQNFPAEKCRFIDESDISDAKGLMRDTKNTICVCINRISQQHLSNEVTRSGLPNNFISLKWQFYQRRLACTVLVSLGKCLAKSGKVHQAHGAILHSIAALYNSTVSILSSPSSRSPLLDFIGKEIKGDVFGLDRARILYNLCKLSLQTYHSRSVLCDLSHIPYQTLVSLLTLAFVLSREDPILCRKISRLLAVLYLVSSIGSEFSFPCDGELSLSHWVTYYHQASLGANINYHFLSKFIKSGSNSNKEASQEFDFLRLAPKSTDGLVKFAKNFFNGLPETTAICISVLGGTLSKLLQELLKSPQVCGWLLLSRLSSKSQQPLAVLLPIYSSLEEGKFSTIHWMKNVHIPCGGDAYSEHTYSCTIRDYSIFLFLKEACCIIVIIYRNLEDTWLGPWRHLLLGESSNSKLHESTQKKLVEELRAKCNMEVNETLLKVFLGNETADGGDAWISQLCSKNGCYIGGHPSDHIDEENGSSISDDLQSRYRLALQLIRDSGIKLEDYNEKREPIILVLDHEIQMLPWENIPTLRRQEVYRMPSVGSISAVLKKSCYREDPSPFLVIDPRDSCYLLDPCCLLNPNNCKTLQTVLEGLSEIKEIKIQVEAGLEPRAPSAQELKDALGTRDLFLYHGHGTGEQYIPMREVENMNKCSAAFLMGCCSGLPYRGGRYVPKSVPISFLLAGSPVIVATLWFVAGDDISKFEKAMLESFWRERSDDVKPERIGSLMADARYACAQQFLTGAAVVWYGVPTAITTKRKKKNT
ncbi:separase-like [Brassica napus]|uniref:separase-like n=1 Tax=Brassica napus TaxID=3708 RepID=UPI002079B652|nr:separase-like [Brassica napus]